MTAAAGPPSPSPDPHGVSEDPAPDLVRIAQDAYRIPDRIGNRSRLTAEQYRRYVDQDLPTVLQEDIQRERALLRLEVTEAGMERQAFEDLYRDRLASPFSRAMMKAQVVQRALREADEPPDRVTVRQPAFLAYEVPRLWEPTREDLRLSRMALANPALYQTDRDPDVIARLLRFERPTARAMLGPILAEVHGVPVRPGSDRVKLIEEGVLSASRLRDQVRSTPVPPSLAAAVSQEQADAQDIAYRSRALRALDAHMGQRSFGPRGINRFLQGRGYDLRVSIGTDPHRRCTAALYHGQQAVVRSRAYRRSESDAAASALQDLLERWRADAAQHDRRHTAPSPSPPLATVSRKVRPDLPHTSRDDDPTAVIARLEEQLPERRRRGRPPAAWLTWARAAAGGIIAAGSDHPQHQSWSRRLEDVIPRLPPAQRAALFDDLRARSERGDDLGRLEAIWTGGD